MYALPNTFILGGLMDKYFILKEDIYKILDNAQIPESERQRIKMLIDEQPVVAERKELATGS